ncbi:hypothetical protein HBI56_056410 [Parastagonospora nodorum]|uniref:Uncharacterized protein n=1 Tax=Phaeosphaeria nodorum (strain SN15 / ATCC MYA-4574 / FGSC 10173) TaxID=321614 RepID=A0A7U2NR10_PHANO|nr:hypothetical protein HBH56_095700 [Parastagonospora nodorum]QRD07183.1 hypothetical protein JI435_424040 [Parastagonospora nodorum SN15]KAH3930342.1 hypothetical protein HBH54_110020 [Parastagonospora nodorum]KAH3966849.1 hypothetical protein HBH51_140820 [Parastagonospora nodorum]KAH3981372.1 hypothetical protein HBH52_083470 [Parastagonospora nodorum]
MTDDSRLHHLATTLAERRYHWHSIARHRGYTGEGGSTDSAWSSCDALSADCGHVIHADVTGTSRRPDTDNNLVKP